MGLVSHDKIDMRNLPRSTAEEHKNKDDIVDYINQL